MKNSAIKRIALEIETNRQRLNHAMITRNAELATRTLGLLGELHAAFFNEMKDQVGLDLSEEYLLLFCEENQDGIRIRKSEYPMHVAKMDEFDRRTHMVVPIASDAEELLVLIDEVLNNSSIDIKTIKTQRGA